MTEVPEHLLKMSRDARARLTGVGGDTDDSGSAPAADAAPVPAATAARVPAVAAEPDVPAVPDPDSPWVEAAKARKTIPYWVMPVLLFLPIWAIYYVGYLERPPVTGGLAVEGAEVFGTCAGCHGSGGSGGSGRQLNAGEVTATFPFGTEGFDGLAGQIAWVANGSTDTGVLEDSSTYGDPDRPGGPRVIGETGAMSGFGSQLSLEELVAVVFHERSQFGGLEPEQVEEEFEILEEFLHVREELGDTDIADETVEEVSETLNEARANVGGSGAE